MNGIDEQEFLGLNSQLYNHIAIYKDIIAKNKDAGDLLGKAKFHLDIIVSELIDASRGKTITDDDKLEASFKNLFELARSIKQHTYYASHFRAQIKGAKNDEAVNNAAEQLYIHNKMLENSIDKAYALTEILNNYKSKTK